MASNKNVDTVLSALDVVKLLVQKSIPHRLKVSMKGTVTSLSRMIRVNSDYLFMLEVDSCVPILVKDFQLEWHSQLQPGGTYIFHDLIMTTVEKGISEPQAVMLAWKDSRVTETKSSSDDIRVDHVDNWLLSHGITADLTSSANGDKSCQQDKSLDNLVNYEGQVTSTQDSKDGFYTLDGKIRLYCHDANLVVNNEIFVFNAHLIELDSVPYLVCCERSLLREKESSYMATTSHNEKRNLNHVNKKKDSTGLESIFKKCHLTLKEMLCAMKIRDSMLHLRRSNQIVRQAMKQLLCENSSGLGIRKRSKRFLDNFLHHAKVCPHAMQGIMMNRVPEVLSLPSLKFWNSEKQEELSQIDANSRNNFYASQQSIRKNSNKMLVGTINVDSRNQLYFSDGSENLPLLILEKPYDEPSITKPDNTTTEDGDVTCDKLNQFPAAGHPAHSYTNISVDSNRFGQYIVHPLLVPNLINKVIFVREFCIVTERYKNPNAEDVENQLTYLAFCLQHCLLFDEVDNPTSALTQKSSELFACGSKNNGTGSCSCYIFVETKSPLRSSYSTDILEFEIFGQILKTEENVENIHSDYPNSGEFVHGNLPKKPKHSQISNQSGDPNFSSRRSVDQSSCNWESVSVVFSGVASECYHYLHPENLYSLYTAKNMLVPSYANSHLQKAAQFCAVRQRMKVTEAVRLKQLVRPTPSMVNERPPEYSIQDILPEGFTDSIVSFCCQVQSRYTANSIFHEKLTSPAFVMANICLLVREMSTEESKDAPLLPVYIDTPKNVYSFGLVPGSVIHFICLERRVSQADNVYCRFTAASSLQVLALHPIEQVPRAKNPQQAPVLSELPKVLLADLWVMDPDNNGEISRGVKLPAKQKPLYLLECHICIFFQLIIKTVCSFCKEVFVDGKCQGKRCRNDAHPVLKAQAVVLVDDGSGQATVTFHNARQVANLLTLTDDQWNDISEGLSDCGQLFITKDSSVSSSPVAQLLSSLCSSSMVLRPCKMAVTRDQKSSCQYLVDQKALDEFQIREVKIAKTSVNTWSLPLLSLECFALEEIR